MNTYTSNYVSRAVPNREELRAVLAEVQAELDKTYAQPDQMRNRSVLASLLHTKASLLIAGEGLL